MATTNEMSAIIAAYDVSSYQARTLLRATRGDMGLAEMALRRYVIHGVPWSAILRWAKARSRKAVFGDDNDDQ